MSEVEAKATETAAATAEETPAANGGKPKDRKPRDETPIEELYDLSKPIPKVRFCRRKVIVVAAGCEGRRCAQHLR